jgi:DNA-directed RNA polymerase specialized sigma24 family protein
MIASLCDCLICRLETRLIAELSDDRSNEEFRLLAAASPTLFPFPNAFELIRSLHDYENPEQSLSADQILLELLRRDTELTLQPIWQRLLLLVFIPTVHRTASQVSAAFALLTRDDIAQHIFAALLEFLHSEELRSRRSHLAYTVARKLRRNAFRWAIRESHRSLSNETKLSLTKPVPTDVGEEFSHSQSLLQQFLDKCERQGQLSAEERELLTHFKLEGLSSAELACRNGHSAVAIRHRIHRVMTRLRRVARNSPDGKPEQLTLFSS